MLDSPEGVCARQVGFEYPATSIPFSNFGRYGRARPAGMAFSTAVPCSLLIRPPWPWAATRDEDRVGPAKLGFPWCKRAR
jgi:hypothetical protein